MRPRTSNRLAAALALATVIALCLNACGGSSSGLSEKTLRDGTYDLPGVGTITLRDGSFRQQSGPGATEVTRADLAKFALGDLNGDGAQDAIVILTWNGGGSGTFYSMTAVLNQDGSPRQAASQLLGDRIRLNSLEVKGGAIAIDFITQGPNDPLCCPTLEQKLRYKLQGSGFELINS